MRFRALLRESLLYSTALTVVYTVYRSVVHNESIIPLEILLKFSLFFLGWTIVMGCIQFWRRRNNA